MTAKDMPVDNDKKYYVVSMMTARDLYDVLCEELNFDKMIELYKLIKHKMEFLDDEPIMEIACYGVDRDDS